MDLDDRARFEQIVLPHLDAAFNLARWMLRSRADAEDVAQEALLRAYRFFGGFHGGDARAWLLQIVRNTCYTWLQKNRPAETMAEFDETQHSIGSAMGSAIGSAMGTATEIAGGMGSVGHAQLGGSPEAQAMASEDRERLTRALEQLPPNFREVLVLRELEGCSYKEIAAITSAPIGTVMSALSRARKQLQIALTAPVENTRKEVARGL
jgi:RNA polymerase sigma-70 factor, ECF subfamily